MKNPFDTLSEMSVDKPKTVIAVAVISILALSSFAQFIVFDNSEDAFYPDNETTDLLYELENTYTVDVDLVRSIVRFEAGDLENEATWNLLANIESDMLTHTGDLENSKMIDYHYGLFGGSPNSGPASSVIFWQQVQDPGYDTWSEAVETALMNVVMADDVNLSSDITEAMIVMSTMPSTEYPDSDDLDNWNVGMPGEWQTRMDSGENNAEKIARLIGIVSSLTENRNETQNASIAPLQGQAMASLAPLSALQEIDLRTGMMSMFPAESRDNPWSEANIALVTLAIDTKPSVHNMELDTEVSPIISEMTVGLEESLLETHGSTITVFGFNRFAEEQAGNLGAEIGILTSASIVILGIILWRQFRSVRDTSIVIFLTLLAIGATYGVAGILKLEFNGAMNSIPILLLAIGVDYGLHVVLRYREELANLDSEGKETMADFSAEARAKAIKTGTMLTSAALVVAIFTDMVGFLSFRLSAQNFLVVFGTVIAVGLFFIYLLSITALPALLTILKPQKIAIAKSVRIEESKFSIWSGEQALNPMTVIIAALLISLPIGAGISQLEIGFDFRDQLDEEIPVVADFLVLSDDFAGQNTAPLYVVINTEVFSDTGRASYLEAMSVLDADTSISEQTGVWELLELEATRDGELRAILDTLDTDSPEWLQLQNWVDANQDLTFRYLRGDFKQTVISFYAPSLDWQETVDFVTGLDNGLNANGGEYKVSGRGLILAQISEDVARSAVASTGIVAGVILLMLVVINVSREETPQRGMLKGFVMWLPLAIVVVWVYGLMGWFGYQLNSQTVTIGALTLGLGVDYAVHFVTRMDEEIEHNPTAGIVNWVSLTNATTGRAMMAAALTTAGGFAVLNLSSLLPLRLFGQVFVIAILLALASSIILLPCLMSLFGLLPKEESTV
tara:strand:- start:102 stop:2822 length:2721 start_codon:yes stop_codon:yes gene_type:complete